MPSTTSRHRLRPLALLAAVAITLAACSSTGAGPATPASAPPSAAPSTAAPSTAASEAASPAAAAGNAVSIANFAFNPAKISVGTNTTITWTNNDAAGHTVTADDGSFDSKTLAPGATFSQTFTKPGTFTYHCAIHSSMTATITVQ